MGGSVLANLERCGFAGDIHLVSRSRAEINGRPCVPSIDDLPHGVDAAVLVVPQTAVLDAIAACGRRGVGAAIVFASGFAEVGDAGRAEQESSPPRRAPRTSRCSGRTASACAASRSAPRSPSSSMSSARPRARGRCSRIRNSACQERPNRASPRREQWFRLLRWPRHAINNPWPAVDGLSAGRYGDRRPRCGRAGEGRDERATPLLARILAFKTASA